MNPIQFTFAGNVTAQGLPELFWYVDVWAKCPQCGGRASLDTVSGGGSILFCSDCAYRSKYEKVNGEVAKRDVLQQIALRGSGVK